MKNNVLFLLFIALGGCVYGQKNDQYALLWQVSAPTGKSSYIFGSMHSNDRRLFNFPDSVYVALDRAEVISLETDIFSLFESFDPQQSDVNLKFDSDGKPYTNNNRASKSAYGNEDGMPQFLDAYFQQYCYNSGKAFFPLETVDFQMNTFVEALETPSFEEADYSMLLSSKDEMLDLYLKGDIAGMNEFIQSALSIVPDSYESLIVERNKNMVEKLQEKFAETSVFCAVGAGHLAGEIGILNLLRKKGFKVRKMKATYSANRPKEEASVRSVRSYTFADPEIQLRLSFPGKPQETELYNEEQLRCIYREFGQGNSYSLAVHNRGEMQSWEEIAAGYLPSPEESPYQKIELPNGGEAIQGLGQEYWNDSMEWIRVLLTEDFVIVLKASGGNKFMNSPRAFRFFDTLEMF